MNAALAVPHDAKLPRLAQALDPEHVAAVFGDALGPCGLSVSGCVIDRIKYRPGRNCTLSYRLQLHDPASNRSFEQRVAARLCGQGDAIQRAERAAVRPVGALSTSDAGPALRLIKDLQMVTWWWPNDAKLTAPHVLSDAQLLQEHVLPELVSVLSGGRGQLVAQAVEIAQYVPEQRLTARVDLKWTEDGRPVERRVYAKSSRDPDGGTVHRILRQLQHSPAWRDGCLRTPAAWLWQPSAALHWQQAMPGVPFIELPPEAARTLAGPLGSQLAALHATPVDTERRIGPPALQQRLAEVLTVLSDALPMTRDLLQRLAAPLAGGIETLAADEPVTLHGDLHPRNILVDGDRLALIDLDGLRRGAAALELGAWVADGMYRAVLEGADPMRDAAAWQAQLAGYAAAGGQRVDPAKLAWATAWNLLTQRAWRCVVNLKPGRFAVAPDLVALATIVLAAGDLELS